MPLQICNNQRLSHRVLVIAKVSTPKSFSLRADNGQGLILRAITKPKC